MNDILETLDAAGSFKTLLALLKLAGMTDRLKQPGPLTLFAPDDEAFKRVNIDVISKDRNDLITLLKYHLLPQEFSAADIARTRHLDTVSGKSLSVSLDVGRQVIDNAKYVSTDIKCSNGIIHVIDNVFLPEFSGWYCGGC